MLKDQLKVFFILEEATIEPMVLMVAIMAKDANNYYTFPLK